MANVTKSEIPRGLQAGQESEPLTPAEIEKALGCRVQLGDVEAYEELVRTHQRRVLAVVGRILRGSEDVESLSSVGSRSGGKQNGRRRKHRHLHQPHLPRPRHPIFRPSAER